MGFLLCTIKDIKMPINRLSVTPTAVEVIEKLKRADSELVFNQSGGCCDGTAPMCYERAILCS